MSDEWWTPDDLYQELVDLAAFTPEVDYAATKANSKCKDFIDERTNALTVEWRRPGWLNPPNSQLSKFVQYALEQWERFNTPIILLAPIDVFARKYTSRIWDTFSTFGSGSEIQIVPVYNRPKFLYEGKPSKYHSRNGYCAIIFKERVMECLH